VRVIMILDKEDYTEKENFWLFWLPRIFI